MTSPLPGSPATPQTRSLADLEARLRTSSNAQQATLTRQTADQVAELAEAMQAQLEWHVDDFTTHLRAELRSTSADIDRHLGHMRSSAQQVSTWTRRALLWPLLLTGGLVLALMLLAVGWGWDRISGLPTEVLTVKGQPMQVLTDPDWTTCTWQDRKQPCRPVDR
ncbi:MAG: hypothetical protein MUD05_11920 [Candidatus Nanopelagicales bacterium]|jgi:ABC-type transport system involved in cytochrome bd biosynthesis fused ATPase/permease subunit|nr:hypothetical protein [Candidatus Nanopelagicales bacterium]